MDFTLFEFFKLHNIYFFSLLLFVYLNKCSIASGICTNISLTSQTAHLFACAYAVDYLFYLPPTISQADLNNQAKALLDKPILSIIPTECQVHYKKLTCSILYKKCHTNVNLSDINTFNNDIYPNFPLPFQRPCSSVCFSTQNYCGRFSPLNEQLKLNCTHDQFNYTLHPTDKYDPDPQSTVCNNMTSTKVKVAETREVYLNANNSKGACYGIVSDIFIPPGPKINASFAPMLSPFTFQMLSEIKLKSLFDKLPVWMDKKCNIALKKYFCSKTMLSPELYTIGDLFKNKPELPLKMFKGSIDAANEFKATKFYLPKYPSLSICQDYRNACQDFISRVNMPELIPNCSGVTIENIQQFPEYNQTVLKINLNLSSNIIELKAETFPNTLSNIKEDLISFETDCPYGFVVPDDPSDEDATMIPGSGCALSCKNPYLTDDEWASRITIANVLPFIGFFLVIILLVNWLSSKDKPKHYLIISFASCSAMVSLFLMIMSGRSFEQKFCRNNAVPLNYKDGTNLCNVQSFGLIYSLLAGCLSWTALAVELFLRSLFGVISDGYWYIYLTIIFGFPIIPVVYVGVNGYQGFSSAHVPWCFISRQEFVPQTVDANLFYLPVYILSGIGFICMFFAFLKILRTIYQAKTNLSNAPENSSSSSKMDTHLKAVISPILFCLSFSLLFSSSFVFWWSKYHDRDKIENSLKSWITCMFLTYDGDIQESYAKCNRHPEVRINNLSSMFMVLGISGQSILFSVIFLNIPETLKNWFNYFKNFKKSSTIYIRHDESKIIPNNQVTQITYEDTESKSLAKTGVKTENDLQIVEIDESNDQDS